jgi:hypothetical protein
MLQSILIHVTDYSGEFQKSKPYVSKNPAKNLVDPAKPGYSVTG